MPPTLTGVVQIVAGDRHSLTLKSDGSVVAWGKESDNQVTIPAVLVATVP
ncbi:MAG TPA: RCC1 domain-containing protein [Gemmatimonadaceae bacterium]